MSNFPPFLPEVISHWETQLNAVKQTHDRAEKAVDRSQDAMRLADDDEARTNLQFRRLEWLEAAQTFNSFVESGKQYITVAQDAERRLQRPNLGLLERAQLSTTRDIMYTLASEFTRFKTENQVTLKHVRPVEVDGQIHYIDGRVEWSGSVEGLAGQAWQDLKEFAGEVKEALIRGPFTTDENRAICQSALGNLLPSLAGKTISAPGTDAGAILFGEALGQAINAADPAGEMCRVVYPQGTSPVDRWRWGQVMEGFDPVADQSFTVVFYLPPEVADARFNEMYYGSGMADLSEQALQAMIEFAGVSPTPLAETDFSGAWDGASGVQELASELPSELPSDSTPVDDWADSSYLAELEQPVGGDVSWLWQLDNEALSGGGAAWEEYAAVPASDIRSREVSPTEASILRQYDVLVQAMSSFAPPPMFSGSLTVTPYQDTSAQVLAPSLS